MREAQVLSSHPLEALLQLDKAAREGMALVVMPADPRLDPDLKDDAGEHFDPRDHAGIDEAARALVEARRKEVRLIGPVGALVFGPGDVALVSALGPGFGALKNQLGERLRVGVDLGLGWDVGAGEVLSLLEAEAPRIVLLALGPSGPGRAPESDPPSMWAGLADSLASLLARGIAVIAVADPADSGALAAHGVHVVSDLRALVAVAQFKPGPVAVVSALGAGPLVDGLIDTFELPLAELAESTLLVFERELPRFARVGPHLQIPPPTPRHLEVIRAALGADPAVGEVWWALEDPDPWATARVLARCAKIHTQGPTATIRAGEPRPRVQAELMGLRLMKRLTLERDAVATLLGAELEAAPSFTVTSLAAAIDAAERLGWPVRLAGAPTTDSGALTDRAELTEAWERLIAGLGAPGPGGARGHDAWHARRLLPALETVRLRYTSHPLPVATLGDETHALPARLSAMERLGPLAGVLRALTALASNHPEVSSLELELDHSGRLVDGSGELLPLPA